jgi:hypothetical protein
MTSPTPPRSSSRTCRLPLLIWQDLWATPFVDALRASAVLIEASRIPHDVIEAAEAELAAAG